MGIADGGGAEAKGPVVDRDCLVDHVARRAGDGNDAAAEADEAHIDCHHVPCSRTSAVTTPPGVQS